ncbi:hypothetical protein [Actinomycetospora sp. NBRC 106378]|uniref:hypothetical protein n=1 Tax=Actinomycetospora sp. NBRC 106378 TaxID=3032208 RepID=UPI0024A3CA6E|nr:hypothetical protein [Actinomycetospora sp. NBRC 106378]GLZ51745.1 hypothetical protein Acsp07_13620 [Actinomycetospora sp. NBRC 106378]
MTAAPDADVLTSLLRHLDEHLGDSHAEGGADVPPPDWTVDGVQIDPEQRARVVTEAAEAGYIEITHQDRFPLPTAITPEGRQLARREGAG